MSHARPTRIVFITRQTGTPPHHVIVVELDDGRRIEVPDADFRHFDRLAERLRAEGVDADADALRALPFEPEIHRIRGRRRESPKATPRMRLAAFLMATVAGAIWPKHAARRSTYREALRSGMRGWAIASLFRIAGRVFGPKGGLPTARGRPRDAAG